MSGRASGPHRPTRPLALLVGALGTVVLAGGCDEILVDRDRELRIDATGGVEGSVYLDLDGSGTRDPADQPAVGLRIQLVPQGGGGAVSTALTDTAGAYRMEDVPVGSFRLVVDPATVPDSLLVFDRDTTAFVVPPEETLQRNFRLSFPTHPLGEIPDLPAGRRVFTHGFALNPRDPFGDAVLHLQEGERYLRAIRVERADALTVGDSVRIQGRTGTEAGRPVLTDVRVFILTSQAVLPRPVEVGSGEAASARGGALDAALVQIRNAQATGTHSEPEGLVVTANDGTGSVEVVLREFLSFDLEPFQSEETVVLERAAGLLVPLRTPAGEVRWRLAPRFPSDLVVVVGAGS